MNDCRHKDFLLRRYIRPVLGQGVLWCLDQPDVYPRIESEERREIVYQGDLWPTPDEIRDAIDKYRTIFAVMPEQVILPRLNGAKFFGVEILV